MPKVIIEYTDNIDENTLKLSEMIDEMHTTFGACDAMAPERIMIFAHKVTHYSIETRAPNHGAILVTVGYLSGRTEPQQVAFGKACANTVQKYVDKMGGDTTITVKAYLEEFEHKTLIVPD